LIRGLIFDFDGLLVDTEGPAYDSWQEIYRGYGRELPLSVWAAVLGGSGREFDPCAYLQVQVGQPLDCDAIRRRRWARKLRLTNDQPLLPGVAEYIADAKHVGLKLAVASSSSHRWVDGHLDRLQIRAYFDAIICADDVVDVKPDPALYQTALRALNLEPHAAIAFEDAPNGLLAAKRAGLFTVAVPNPLTGQLPIDADVRLVSLADMPLAALLAQVEEQSRDEVRATISAAKVTL
jgi:HAD superfamily hydrolase (TIGR01509 family)